MVTFVALYRGESVAHAEVVGLSADPQIVAEFAARLMERSTRTELDPILAPKRRAERQVLRSVRAEALARRSQ
jgi:hypothetical protein